MVTYQHAVVAVFVKKKEACLGRHSNLLLSADAVVGVEDGLTATTLIITSCRASQI